MPTDALTYSLCAAELNNTLSNGKINKITMPHSDTIILNIRASGRNYLLLLSANPSTPRMHITKTLLPSPQVAPGFLMHLRKHIGNGSIEAVFSTPFERAIILKIRANNELMIPQTKKLIVEIMGKHSNIILVNENDIISDSIKHVTMDISGKRQILPGLPYSQPPPQTEKINVSQKELLIKKLSEFEGGNLEKYLQKLLYGLAAATIKEAIFIALGKVDPNFSQLTIAEIEQLTIAFNKLYNFDKARPCALKEGNTFRDFFSTPYLSAVTNNSIEVANLENFVFFDSLNDAMDSYYTSASANQSNTDKRNLLGSIIRNAIAKNQKKLGMLLQKQQDAADCEADRKKGDLLLSNLHKIRKGDSEIEVEDYYDNNNLIHIKIDSNKTPQANAQLFYKSYNKKKNALLKLEELIEDVLQSIEFLESLSYFAETLEDEEQYSEILDELAKIGLLKRKITAKKDKPKKQGNYDSTIYEGYKILIGKSSLSNDLLVKKAAPEYVWLHASGIHGSHVIIENHSPSMPPNKVLIYAAQIAAYNSKAKLSENVPVDYTFVNNVKKPKAAASGKVIFSNQKTLFVSPKKQQT